MSQIRSGKKLRFTKRTTTEKSVWNTEWRGERKPAAVFLPTTKKSISLFPWDLKKLIFIRLIYSRFMAWQSEMAATLQQHHNSGVLVTSAASPTPSLDSLTGMILANGHSNGEATSSESGLASTMTSTNDRNVSSSSASSSGLGSSPLGNGSLFSTNATKCAICSGTYSRPKVNCQFHQI